MLQMKSGSSKALKQEYCPVHWSSDPCALFHMSMFAFILVFSVKEKN